MLDCGAGSLLLPVRRGGWRPALSKRLPLARLRRRAAQLHRQIAASARPCWAAAVFAINLISSPASLSVSRLAVPLPIASNCTPCFWLKVANWCSAPSQSLRGSCGNTVAVSTSLPVATTTATFTPVRINFIGQAELRPCRAPPSRGCGLR